MKRTTLGRSTHVPVPAQARRVLEAVGQLAQAQGVSVYAVGGCVRDWCLGRDRAVDLDVAVEGDAIALARAVAAQWHGTERSHAQFGTATVQLVRGPVRRLDFAMCRQETYSGPAAYPRVHPGRLTEDLFRRDFTINAMAAALSPRRFGQLEDPYGGRPDVERGILRVLHERSFVDDPTRLLRGIRFAVRFGFAFEPRTRKRLIESLRDGALTRVNPGRLSRELDQMLKEPDPAACLRMLHHYWG